MKLATFFISNTKKIYAKRLTGPEIAFEIKTIICWIILLTSAVICNANKDFFTKTRLCKIFKYQDVDQGLLACKPLHMP